MIKFVILDKDERSHIILRNIVNYLSFNVRDEFHIKNYQVFNPDFIREINDLEYKKVYILNVDEMGDFLVAAKFIRKYDWDSQIILIADSKELLDQYYSSVYNIFAYLVKDKDFRNKLQMNISYIINQKFCLEKFIFQNKCQNISIYYKNILYIYRDTVERKVVVVTNCNEYKINISLKSIMELLNNRFIQCHRACIMNRDRVEATDYTNKYFKLDNGKVVYMLSDKYKDIVERNL